MLDFLKNKLCYLICLMLITLDIFSVNVYADDEEVIENTRYTLTEEEEIMLQKIALAEAGHTTVYDMALVIQVVLNRVESDEFPDSVEEVIKQKNQFSTYPNAYNKFEPNFNSSEALRCATADFMGNEGALFFENTVKGSWISTHKQFLYKHGNHSFYK